MRIISGEMRGFKLKAPKGMDTRPTSDKVKESLFSIMGYIESSSEVLDLYSGSGNIGLEFLSRGAESACFIDTDAKAISTIKDNIEKCKVSDRATVYKNDVSRAMEMLANRSKKFDYIFMDPPYKSGLVEKTIDKVAELDLLKDGGLLIAEHERGLVLEDSVGSMKKVDNRRYGDTEITFYRK